MWGYGKGNPYTITTPEKFVKTVAEIWPKEPK
jgi:hypothetical protein